MIFTLNLFLLELKRTIKFLPRLIICILLLSAALYGIIRLSPSDEDAAPATVRVGYFVPEDDKYISMFSEMVNSMESVKSICTIEEAESEQAVYDGLEDGTYYSGIIFPKDYLKGIMYGYNNPAVIMVPENGNSSLFRRLVSIGADMLVSVQAGIYAASEERPLEKNEIISINMNYVNFVLTRNDVFKEENWSPYGSLSFAQYYCVMGLSLFTMIVGICLSFLFYNYSSGFENYCKLWGYNGIFMLVLKQLTVFVITAAATFPLIKLANEYIPFVNDNYTMIFAAVFISSQLVTCFYTIFGGSAVLLLIGFTAVTAFFSGCFVPLVYLSSSGLDKIAGFMPINTVSECFFTLYSYKEASPLPMIIAIYAAAFLIGLVKKCYSKK